MISVIYRMVKVPLRNKNVRNLSIHEHQSMKLLSENGIPVPRGALASSPEEAYRIAQGFGS